MGNFLAFAFGNQGKVELEEVLQVQLETVMFHVKHAISHHRVLRCPAFLVPLFFDVSRETCRADWSSPLSASSWNTRIPRAEAGLFAWSWRSKNESGLPSEEAQPSGIVPHTLD